MSEEFKWRLQPWLAKPCAAIQDCASGDSFVSRHRANPDFFNSLPSADTAAMLFWALLASGQINMRKVNGWLTLATKLIDQPIDRQLTSPLEPIHSFYQRSRHAEFQPRSRRHPHLSHA